MANVNEISDDMFKEEVLDSEKPTVVDFWAPWCAPCQMTAPVFEAVSEILGDKLNFVKMNTEDYPKTAIEYKVMAIPSLLVFKDGKEIDRVVGFLPEDKLEERLVNVLES